MIFLLLGINYLVALIVAGRIIRMKSIAPRKKFFLILTSLIFPLVGPLMAFSLSESFKPGYIPPPRKEFDLGGSAHAFSSIERSRAPNREERRRDRK